MAIEFSVNGKTVQVDVEDDTPLLWVLRDELELKGTKFGCGMMLCGACTVLMDGRLQRTCMMPVSSAAGKSITTIEGLDESQNPVQRAWREIGVPQCGYCQSGQILVATKLLENTPSPTDEDIDKAMVNLCRCGSYQRIRQAIHLAAELQKEDGA